MSKSIAITFIVIFALEASVIVIANSFTIFVFWKHRFRLKRTCYLLINLATADLLVGIAEAVVLATKKIHNARNGMGKSQSFSPIFHAFASSTSVMFLALISLERAYAVLWPFRHRVTNTRAYICSIVTVWVAALCMAGLRLYVTYRKNVNTMYSTITADVLLLIALLIICASYLTIRSRLNCTAPEQGIPNQRLRARNVRFSKTFFIVVAVSLVFWFPAFVVYTINHFCSQCFPWIVLSIVNILHLANSIVNPFVYSFGMPIFKETLKREGRKLHQNIELNKNAQDRL